MLTFDVDDNNDLVLDGSGELARVQGQQAASVVCKQFARAARAEMVLKMDKGMPFWPLVFGKNANLNQFEAAFRSRMREIPQVRSVSSFFARLEDGVLKYEAEIQTIFGQIGVSDNG